MIFITSIAPKHYHENAQQKAIESWLKLGDVYSVNTKEEIGLLEPIYNGVKFIQTEQTMESLYSKKYVALNAIISACKWLKYDHYCIINSDIELRTDKDTIQRISNRMNNGLVLANRVNYGLKNEVFYNGIDVFFLHRNYLDLYLHSEYALGQCHFDYWIPYLAIKKGYNVTFIEQQIAFHKEHPQRFDNEMWLKTGRYFRWQNNLFNFGENYNGIGQMSKYIYNFIYNSTNRETI